MPFTCATQVDPKDVGFFSINPLSPSLAPLIILQRSSVLKLGNECAFFFFFSRMINISLKCNVHSSLLFYIHYLGKVFFLKKNKNKKQKDTVIIIIAILAEFLSKYIVHPHYAIYSKRYIHLSKKVSRHDAYSLIKKYMYG
jgi:hypothetical protein